MIKATYLDKILQDKHLEVQKLEELCTIDSTLKDILDQPRKSTGSFSKALKGDKLSVIAEIKRESPSKGMIGTIEDPVHLALKYCQGGASAISILTDATHFGGSLNDLMQVKKHLEEIKIEVPLLRKDFLLHELQLAEAVLSGASAVLLIANALDEKLKVMLDKATFLGLETLVEVHDEHDLELAIEAGAKIIGVNNRDLKTFKVNVNISEKLRSKIPKRIITVSESGINTVEDAVRMRDAGYDAILVGEALVKSKDPAVLISNMRGI